MGRQGGETTTMVSSSIALLQQRFRQLEKAREKREEKELLKLLSGSGRVGPNTRYESNMQRVPHHDSASSLSLGLSSHGGRRSDYRAMAILGSSSSSSIWPPNDDTLSTPKKFETFDVDTSLHL